MYSTFNSLKIKNYSFKLDLGDLILPEHAKALNIEEGEQATIEGEFSVAWDDDIPMVQIEDIFLCNGEEVIKLSDSDVNIDEICNIIEYQGDSGDWFEDRLSAAMDRDWDLDR